ncbi:MAG: RNA polymerase sigma factor region1.1 domain-containing protein, partial [Solirubrobacteraceae bacterium]
MSVDEIVLLSDETPIVELDELRPLIAAGQERGWLSFAEIEACLEEVEVGKEQLAELRSWLDEHGIEVVGADGKPAPAGDDGGGSGGDALSDGGGEGDGQVRRAPQLDLTVEPSLDSLRLYLRAIGRVA